MLKDYEYIYSRLNVAADWLMAAGALVCAHGLRNYVLAPYIVPDIFRYPSRFQDYWWLVIFLPTAAVAILGYNGHYRSVAGRRWRRLSAGYFAAAVGSVLAAALVSFALTPRGATAGFRSLFTEEFVSRGVLALFVPTATVLLLMKQALFNVYFYGRGQAGSVLHNMLLVGSPRAGAEFVKKLEGHPRWGFQVIGIATDGAGFAPVAGTPPVVATYENLFDYLETHVVDDVVFLPADEEMRTFQPLLRGCEEMGIRTRIPLDTPGHNIARVSLDHLNQLPVITFNPVKELGTALLIKYTLDRVLAAIFLILLAPVFAILYIVIKSTGWRDPAFYAQTRCGLHGRRFRLWKFRSMVPDADRVRTELEPQNEMSGPVFKMHNDPRITPVGRFLRRYSLDELPQLWNVLRGDMCLVGPRPPLPEEVQRYDRWQRRRLSMKPGITCIWQVSGRNRLSFEEWMAMDLEYIDNWTLMLDLRILMKTALVVVTGDGAM